MLITLERTILRFKSKFLRFYSVNFHNEKFNYPQAYEDHVLDATWEPSDIRREDAKTLRISILGLPNVGKSTLVNQLVGRPVCAASSKVQTTRKSLDAIYMSGSTQLIFIDTPGLVKNSDMKKYNLEKSFRTDVDKALAKCDIVGVVQDVGNRSRADVIDERILVLLKNLKMGIPTILILNKVDKIKRKKRLLELVDVLTSDKNWPNFSDVFMVSALTSDGVDDLRNYLVESAKPRDWDYQSKVISSDSPTSIIGEAVRAKFMDSLPNELPYKIKVQLEHYSVLKDDSISTVVAIITPSDRISNLVMGSGGCRVRSVAKEVEQELCQVFRTTVRLKIAVKFSETKDESEVIKQKILNKRKKKHFY